MSELYKSSKNIGSNVESKEGERGLLYSNKANVRSPSLGVDEYVFTEETVSALADLGDVLRRIYKRLSSEGYVIETGPAYKDHGEANREN